MKATANKIITHTRWQSRYVTLIAIFFMIAIWPPVPPLAKPNVEKAAEVEPAAPMTHQKKVYVDPKEEYIYWPLDMHFWVRLTPSPDESAPSYLLKNIQIDKEIATSEQMKTGISLEINGRQFIRWYNKVTDKTSLLKFFSDGEVPITTATFTGAPSFNHEKKGMFYGKGLIWTLNAEDSISGVETIYYSIDGATFETYTQPLSLDTEKPYWLRYYAVDHVGYTSPLESQRFNLDYTPPISTRHVTTRFIDDIFSLDTTIGLTAQDSGAGVKEIFYYLDDTKAPTVYSNTKISVNHLLDGEHKITFYADDNVLNREEAKVYSFYLDRTPPKSSSEFVGDHYNDGKTDFISKRTRIKLSSTDNKIGVDTIQFLFDQDKEDKYIKYAEPFSVPLAPGKHVVYFRAIDRLQNLESPVPLPVQMDHVASNSTATITGIKFEQRDITWITKETVVSLTATDDAAGVESINYQLGEENPYKRYTEPLKIPQEGNYLFKYYSIDHVANQESEHPLLFIVDNTPPKVLKTFSVPQVQTIRDENGEEINVYPRFTSLFLGAVDNSAGIAYIRYTINKGKEEDYRIALMFKEAGDYTMTLKVQDNVENSVSETLRFRIKE